MRTRLVATLLGATLLVALAPGAGGGRTPAEAQEASYAVVILRADGTTDTYTYPFKPSVDLTGGRLYVSGTHNGLAIDFIPIPFGPGDRIVRVDGTPEADPNLPRAVPYTGPPIILAATATPTQAPEVVMGPHGPEKARPIDAPPSSEAQQGALVQGAAPAVVPQPARTGHGVRP